MSCRMYDGKAFHSEQTTTTFAVGHTCNDDCDDYGGGSGDDKPECISGHVTHRIQS